MKDLDKIWKRFHIMKQAIQALSDLRDSLTRPPVQVGSIGRRGRASVSDDTDPETVVHVGSESGHLVSPLGSLVDDGAPWAIGQLPHLQPVLPAALTATQRWVVDGVPWH